MQYVPYNELIQTPNIIVDGSGNSATVLTLSHWPHSGTPSEFKADTSAEIALNFLDSPRRSDFAARAEIVSNNHFDEDGLMSVWAMINPELALARRELVIAVATAGDFSRVTTPEAAKIALAIPQMASELCGGQQAADSEKYRALLPMVANLLADPAQFRQYWQSDWERIESNLASFDKGSSRLTQYPQIDLAVVEADRPVDQMAINTFTQCLRILTVFGRGFYRLQYRYESWVQIVSRKVSPRIDLFPLAEKLQQIESGMSNQGKWNHGDTADITPALEFQDFEGTPTPSGLSREDLIAEVVGFFEREQGNPDLQWSPYDDGEAADCGLIYGLGHTHETGINPGPTEAPKLYSLQGSNGKNK